MSSNEIGTQVAKRRKQLNLRQEDLAEMSGITARTIYNIEEGRGNPSLKTIHKICEILGLEISVGIKKIS